MMCRLRLSSIHTTKLRSAWPLVICFAFVVTTQSTAAVETSPMPKKHQQHQHQRHQYQQARGLANKLRGLRLLQPQHRRSTSDPGKGVRTSAWVSPHAERSIWVVRGGQHSNNNKEDGVNVAEQNSKREAEGQQPSSSYSRDFPPPPGTSIAASDCQQDDDSNATVEKLEKIAAGFRAKTDELAADVRARGEAMATDLKAKHERVTDEVLRDRYPEAFGELGGHHSPYDSTTAGMDVANRRAFFLGIRRVVLLAQVVELVIACSWQAAFPYGGVAGFAAGGGDSSASSSGGDGRGRLGLVIAAALGQAAMYTSLLAFFGCDRVVLRAVNVTGWEHGAAAAWVLARVVGAAGKLPHLAACAWLAGMAFLCLYFGRQL